MLEEWFGDSEDLALITLFAGLAIGWLVQWLLDLVYWRRKRICTKIEDELQTANKQLTSENADLRDRVAKCAACETRVMELETVVQTRDELIARLQGEVTDGIGDLPAPVDVEALAERVAGRLETSQRVTLDTIRSELAQSSGGSPDAGSHDPVHCDADVEIIVERLREEFAAVNSTTLSEVRDIVDTRYDAIEAQMAANPAVPPAPPSKPTDGAPDSDPIDESSKESTPQEGIDDEAKDSTAGEPTAEPEPQPAPQPLGPPHHTLYRITHRWDGGDDWRDGGAWILGGRGGEPVVSISLVALADGDGFIGTIGYDGGVTTEFRAAKTGHNTYRLEERGTDGARSFEEATWLIGARWDHDLVALDLTSDDTGDTLQGTCQYRGEGQLSFRAEAVDGVVYEVDTDGAPEPNLWVLGQEPDRPLRRLHAVSKTDGRVLLGTCSFDGETALDLRCVRWAGNTYHAETREPGADEWTDAGLWVVGSSGDDNVIGIELASTVDDRLAGQLTIEGGSAVAIHCRPADRAPGLVEAAVSRF